MIPLHLSLQGLYSYQEKQSIDFKVLTQSQLFGIFGETGSGKSTILEAIGLVLYGKTERLSQAVGRNYNMMNLKSNKMEIIFEFEAKEQRYKFEAIAKRNSKRFSDVPKLNRRAYKEEAGEWLPLESVDAGAILGLSYDHFKRTIIIPQGKFQEFIQLGETDRTRMLKDIFRLHKYEFYDQALGLERENQDEISRKEAVLQTLAAASPEALEEVVMQKQECETKIKQVQETLSLQQKQFHLLEEKKMHLDRYKKQEQELNSLMAQKEAMDAREKHIMAYEDCLVNFKPILDKEQELNQQIQRLNTELSLKVEQQSKTKDQWERAVKTFREVQHEYGKRDQYLLQADELLAIIDLQESFRIKAALQERIEKGNVEVKKKAESLERFQGQRQALRLEIDQLKAKRTDAALLLDLQSWFQNAQQKQELRGRIKSELQGLQNRLNQYQVEQKDLLDPHLPPSQLNLEEEQLQELISSKQEAEIGLLKKLKNESAKVHFQAHLNEFANQLKDGEPCPLCGAVHHPEKANYTHISAIEQEGQAQIEAAEQKVKALQELKLKIELLLRQKKEFALQLKEKEGELAAIIDEPIPGKAKILGIENLGMLQTAISEAKVLEESIASQETQLKVALESEDNDRSALEKYQRALRGIDADLQQQTIKFSAGEKALKFFRFEDYKLKPQNDLLSEVEKLRQNHRNIEETYIQLEQRVQQFRTQVDRLEAEIELSKKQQQQTQQDLAKQRSQLLSKIEGSPYDNVDSIRDLLSKPIDLSRERNLIGEFKQQLEAAKASFKELQLQLPNTDFDADAFSALGEKIAGLKTELEELNRQLGGFEQQVKLLQSQLAQQEELNNVLKALNTRAENIRTLKRLFMRSGFVNYVSTIYLQHLCRVANERFMKFTRGSLRLEITADNQFQVRDFLNGGELRSVKTLSGGQTFQAALSLALALADQVQQQTQAKQNFFFLDEGFGSQDKSSLQLIFQSLKALRKENRIVGVISHVEELQQEIGTYLHVENDPETGSVVKASWA